MGKYDDIINLDRPVSRRQKMPLNDRAAQFAPFAALTRFGDEIKESNRRTEEQIDVDGDYLEDRLREIERAVRGGGKCSVKVKAEYFVRDEKKAGGRYEIIAGRVKKIDRDLSAVVFENGKSVYFGNLLTIEIADDE